MPPWQSRKDGGESVPFIPGLLLIVYGLPVLSAPGPII